MSQKTLNTRIQHKHDIEVNWEKATNFIPLQGEIIVYDVDENFDYERIKIGDGIKNINELAFVTENITHNWADIQNKPFITVDSDTLEWDGNTEGLSNFNDVYFKVSDATPSMTDFANGAVLTYNDGRIFEVPAALISGDSEMVEVGSAIVIYSEDLSVPPGTYFSCANGAYVSSITIPGYTGFTTEKIDEKLIPNTIARVDDIPTKAADIGAIEEPSVRTIGGFLRYTTDSGNLEDAKWECTENIAPVVIEYDDNEWTCSHTPEQIKNLIDNNVFTMLKDNYDDTYYFFSCRDGDKAYYSSISPDKITTYDIDLSESSITSLWKRTEKRLLAKKAFLSRRTDGTYTSSEPVFEITYTLYTEGNPFFAVVDAAPSVHRYVRYTGNIWYDGEQKIVGVTLSGTNALIHKIDDASYYVDGNVNNRTAGNELWKLEDIPVVRYDQQSLTEEQKAQARENIGAISETEVLITVEDIDTICNGTFQYVDANEAVF